MATCSNGWPVLFDNRTTGPLPRLRKWIIPGADRHLFLRDGSAGFLLIHMAVWFHRNIDPLPGGIFDEWGWAVRPIRGQTTGYSNHSGGVAMDLDATQFPRGIPAEARFSADQIRRIRDRLGFYDGLLGWGGDYRNVPDGMHFELAYGSTLSQAETKALALLNSPIGQEILAANPGARDVIVDGTPLDGLPEPEPVHWPVKVVAGNFDFTNSLGDDKADIRLAKALGTVVVLGTEGKDRDMAAMFGAQWTVHQDRSRPARAGSFVAWRNGATVTAKGHARGTFAKLSDLLPRWAAWADLMVDGTTVRFIAAHLPPKRRWNPYWHRMARRLRRLIKASPYPVVVGADWNKQAPEVLEAFGKFGTVTMFGVDGFLVDPSLSVSDPQRLGATRSDHDFVAVDLAPVAAPGKRKR